MQGSRQNEQLERADTSKSNGKASTQKASSSRVAFTAALVLLVIAGLTLGAVLIFRNTNFGTTANNTSSNGAGNSVSISNATGTVSFSDAAGGHSNLITITIDNLAVPLVGSYYDAWLVNSATGQSLALGHLKAKGQSMTLSYSAQNNNLLGAGDTIEITLDKGRVSAPQGKPLLTASFPPHAFVYIRHLLVSYDGTPGKTGLLTGLFGQSQQLNTVAQLLPSAVSGHTVAVIRCAAQAIVNIIEGKAGAHYQPLASTCPASVSGGDGFGLLGNAGYIAVAQAQVSLAANQDDSTSSIKAHEKHVSIALTDMQGWLTTIDQDALALLRNSADTAKAPEIVTLANHNLNGVDTNGDGSIDYVPGEAGATIAYVHAQYMAALLLAPPS